jgi:hypothetical protein
MEEKIKTKEGFIQIPILIAIIVSIVMASGIGYGAIEYHKTSKIIKESEQLTKEEKYDEAIKKLEVAQNKFLGKTILKQKINAELETNKKLLEDKTEYTQGLEEFSKGNWERAKELLSKVSEISPYYQDAKSKLEETQKKITEKQVAKAVEEAIKEVKKKAEEAEGAAKEAQSKIDEEKAKRITANYERIFSFKLYPGDFSHTLTIQIPASTYHYYRSLPQELILGNLLKLNKLVIVDQTILDIVSKIKLEIKGGEEELANALLTFSHSVPLYTGEPYGLEVRDGNNYSRYPGYPIEILVDGSINCVTYATIAGTLMHAAGLDVVFIAWKHPNSDLLGHVAVGVYLHDPPKYSHNKSQNYYIYRGKRYYIADATGDGFVGDFRDDLLASGWYERLYDIVPIIGSD